MSAQRTQRIHSVFPEGMDSLTTMGMGVAHDFNNLLAAILGNALIIGRSLPEDSPAAEGLRQIDGCARRGLDLTRRILTFTGRAPFTAQSVDLSDLVRGMENRLKVFGTEGVTVQLAAARDVSRIPGDPAQIRELVLELATNSSEALIETTGTITVETGAAECDRRYLDSVRLGRRCVPGMYSYIQVSDNGRGISSRDSRKIFDPFFTTKLRGQGLGLCVVLGVLRAHRGALEVWSRRRQGSRFKALFPAAGLPACPSPSTSVPGADRRAGSARSPVSGVVPR